MMKLKVQLHCHTAQDPIDSVSHSEKQLIDRAARLGCDVVAISCHNVVIFNDDLRKYAKDKRVLLIPAIEKTIEKSHVLILNADIKAQRIESFIELRKYRREKPDCFIIAVHPFYPGSNCLGKKLLENKDVFDAVEYSWFHSKKINRFNNKAVKTAEKLNLPVIATSDNHLLRYLDYTYSLIEAEKTIPSLFEAIKKKKIKIVSHDLKVRQLITVYAEMALRRLVKILMPK